MALCPSCGVHVANPGASVCSACGRRLALASPVPVPAPDPPMASVAGMAGDPAPSAPDAATGTPRHSADEVPREGATLARAVGATAVAALLSLFVFPSTAFQQLFLTLIFQNSSFSTEYFNSIEGAAFFAFVLPIAYWVALVRLRHVGMGRALAETLVISLLFGFVVYQLTELIRLAVITWGLPGIDLFAPLRLMWVAPGKTAQTYLPAILAAGLGVALATAFAPWANMRQVMSARDGWRDLAIVLGSVLLIEVLESALSSGVIQVFQLYHAAPTSMRVRVFAGFIRPALSVVSILALYALACVTTLRALRRANMPQ